MLSIAFELRAVCAASDVFDFSIEIVPIGISYQSGGYTYTVTDIEN